MKSSSSPLFKGRGKTEKMINDNAISNKVKLKTKIAVEKYLKASMWKTTKSKAVFKGQNAPSRFEAMQPLLWVSPKIIERKPKTATPIKLIIKSVINADFISLSVAKDFMRVKIPKIENCAKKNYCKIKKPPQLVVSDGCLPLVIMCFRRFLPVNEKVII